MNAAATRRERREAEQHEHVARITVRLRALSGSASTTTEAAAVRDRYARAIFGFGPGVGGDAFIDFLLSEEAGDENIEDIDGRFIALERVQIDAAQHGAGAVRGAALRRDCGS